jgi:hypothetical protein
MPISSPAHTTLNYIEGNKEIKLTTRIHKDSLSYYRYSITENDSVRLVVNGIPSKVDYIYNYRSDHPGYAAIDLGHFAMTDKKLQVKMHRIGKDSTVYTAIIYNKPAKPAKIRSLIVYEPWHDITAPNRIYTGFSAVKIDDKTAGLVITMDKTDLAYLYYVYLKQVASGHVIPLLNRWGLYKDTLLMQINKDYFKEPGEYELSVVPAIAGDFTVQPLTDRTTTIRFIRRTTDVVSISYKQMIVIISFLIGIIVGFIVVKRKNRRKLAKEKLQKELAQLQLNTVRLQLNPHFMFNALAGIQNLMNKQEIDNANRYLGKFARITRHVLDNKELNSLAEEKSLLDDYLQMEQLRFGFQYTVDISVQLDAANIEIPSMLLQPFVENAVIHGVAGLQDKGWITVRFIKNEKDLQIVIKDNGSGFDAQQLYKGLGVSLSKNRISLLNKVYGQATVLLDMVSGEQGSTITITLKQWL